MKQILLKFKALCIICLVMIIGGMNVHAANKITDIADIVSGQKYYICATTAGIDYYLKLASTSASTSTSVAGTAVTDKATANVFIFEGSGNTWSIKIDGTNNYLSLKNEKDNGKVQVVKSATNFTLSNVSKLIKIAKGSYMIQKNSQGNNFGSYSSNQTKVWLEPLEESGKSIYISPATSTVVKAPVIVTLTADAGATIYYTTNGDEPTTTSTKYDAPFEVTKSGTTVKALAVADGAEDAKAEATYTIEPEQPVFSDASKTFKDAFDVTLSLPASTDASSKIYYAIGADATSESSLYEGPINISAENDGDKVILHAVVVDQYGNVGKKKICTYTKTTAIVFDFTANPNAWGINPQKNNGKDGSNVVAGKELKVSGVVMTATNGSQYGTCLYGTTSGTLNVYQGGSITFTAPEGYNISEITFDKTNLFEADKGTFSNGTWTGNAHAVKFSNDGRKIEIRTATIKLVATSLDLSEAETAEEIAKKLTESNGKIIDVKLARTLTAGKWNTICLPFDVTAEQIANVLKSEGNVKEYGSEDVTTQTIYFKDATTMTAGTPYLIKPTVAATELVFKGVTIKNVDAVDRMVGDKYNMCGVFGKYEMNTNGSELFLTTQGKFAVPAPTTNVMKGFRAYFIAPKNTAGAALNLSFGEATGIDGVAADAEKNVKVYNVNGQYVGTSLDALPKGLYIVGGKKVLK